ncbi:MAG: glycosyltransferase N-terminal domain-containing protein [Bilophila sp.]
MRVLATTWTRQGLEILQGMAIKIHEAHPWLTVRATFFPLDAPGVMGRALDQARPRVVGLLETELWPGLLMACEKRHIPVVVLNGRMTEKSLRNYLRLDAVEPDIWKDMAPARVCAVSQADAARFARLFGEDRVETAPNIKFDRAASSPEAVEAPEALRALLPADHAGRTVLLASVREQEEEAALALIRALRAADAPALIVAPRHMHRVKPWRKRLEEAGIPAVLRSRQEGPAPADAVLLWTPSGNSGNSTGWPMPSSWAAASPPSAGRTSLRRWRWAKSPAAGPIWTISRGRSKPPLPTPPTPLRCSASSGAARTRTPSPPCFAGSLPPPRTPRPCADASGRGSPPGSAVRTSACGPCWNTWNRHSPCRAPSGAHKKSPAAFRARGFCP